MLNPMGSRLVLSDGLKGAKPAMAEIAGATAIIGLCIIRISEPKVTKDIALTTIKSVSVCLNAFEPNRSDASTLQQG